MVRRIPVLTFLLACLLAHVLTCSLPCRYDFATSDETWRTLSSEAETRHPWASKAARAFFRGSIYWYAILHSRRFDPRMSFVSRAHCEQVRGPRAHARVRRVARPPTRDRRRLVPPPPPLLLLLLPPPPPPPPPPLPPLRLLLTPRRTYLLTYLGTKSSMGARSSVTACRSSATYRTTHGSSTCSHSRATRSGARPYAPHLA